MAPPGIFVKHSGRLHQYTIATFTRIHVLILPFATKVEQVMVMSVRDVISSSRDAYSHSPRSDWVVKWAGQVVLCVSQIYWTLEVHEALSLASGNGLKDYLERENVSGIGNSEIV